MTEQQEAIHIERCTLIGAQVAQDVAFAYDQQESINPEFGLAWLSHLARTTLSQHETAYIYTARDCSGHFLSLPLRVNDKTKEAHAVSNFYTSLCAPVTHTSQPRVLLEALFRYLRTSEGISALSLSPLDIDEKMFNDCQWSLQQANWRGVHSWHCFWNWTHTVGDGGYAAYLAERPSILRSTIARKTRKFTQSGTGRIQLFTGTDSVEEGIEQFQSVYQRSWKKLEPHVDFIPGLIKLAANKKWLRLAVAYYDQQAIAAQLWLVENNTASIFKLAYDEQFKQLSPGTVLSAFLMKQVIDVDQVTTIDYLSGDDSYKESWMSNRRERRGIAAYNIATLRGLSHWGARRAKQLLKKTAR